MSDALSITVKLTGPMFNGDAVRAKEAYLKAAVEKVSETGKANVDQRLRSVLKNPTGRYQGSINVKHLFDAAIINDGRIVYGPWLEGTGSRNKTTRFKGYHTFRWSTDQLKRQAPTISRQLFEAYVRRMN